MTDLRLVDSEPAKRQADLPTDERERILSAPSPLERVERARVTAEDRALIEDLIVAIRRHADAGAPGDLDATAIALRTVESTLHRSLERGQR